MLRTSEKIELNDVNFGDNMISKIEVTNTMQELSALLNENHPGSETSHFINETLKELQKSEGVAFTGCLQYFFNKAPVVKLSEGITLNKKEKAVWRKVFSFNSLGNNLWGVRL